MDDVRTVAGGEDPAVLQDGPNPAAKVQPDPGGRPGDAVDRVVAVVVKGGQSRHRVHGNRRDDHCLRVDVEDPDGPVDDGGSLIRIISTATITVGDVHQPLVDGKGPDRSADVAAVDVVQDPSLSTAPLSGAAVLVVIAAIVVALRDEDLPEQVVDVGVGTRRPGDDCDLAGQGVCPPPRPSSTCRTSGDPMTSHRTSSRRGE